MNPVSWWVIVLSFFTMHFFKGLIISLVFQTSHILPEAEFPGLKTDEVKELNRVKHQLATTCNFTPKSRFLSWYIGALNFQIEHHLLTEICHIHYKALSKKVRPLIEKYDLPYNTRRNFITAVSDHFKMLKTLGAKPVDLA